VLGSDVLELRRELARDPFRKPRSFAPAIVVLVVVFLVLEPPDELA
jgi:hypothetical protein